MILQMLAKRIGMGIFTVLFVAFLSLVLVHLMPGSPGQVALGASGTPEAIRHFNQEIGWNKPLIEQYFNWLVNFLHGDLGRSLLDNHEIAPDMATRVVVTGSLSLFGVALTSVIGVLAGVSAAVRGGWVDKVLNNTANFGIAVPSYWLAILLVVVLAVAFPIFPATGYVSFADDPGNYFYFLLLPVVSLALPASAGLARVSRAAMLDAFSAEHIRTLRAMGEPRFTLIYKHVLRLASVQIVSQIGLNFVLMFGGTVMVETLFALPGLGAGVLGAIGQHDSPPIQATVVVTTIVVVITNLITEVVIMFVDPKVRTK